MLRSSTKAKVFVHLFQKVVVSRGNAFGRLPQKAKLFIVQALIGRAREPFCKRKGSRKPIESRVQPQKLSGG